MRPLLVIAMGVSGSGKSRLGAALAGALGWRFLEGDAFHSADNRAWMAGGRPLDDRRRDAWITAICAHLLALQPVGESCVLACSSLRRVHRERLRQAGFATLFLHLEAAQHVIAQRLAQREGHFMPAGLLGSQYRDLQRPRGEPDIVSLDVAGELSEVLAGAIRVVEEFRHDLLAHAGSH